MATFTRALAALTTATAVALAPMSTANAFSSLSSRSDAPAPALPEPQPDPAPDVPAPGNDSNSIDDNPSAPAEIRLRNAFENYVYGAGRASSAHAQSLANLWALQAKAGQIAIYDGVAQMGNGYSNTGTVWRVPRNQVDEIVQFIGSQEANDVSLSIPGAVAVQQDVNFIYVAMAYSTF